MRGTITGSDVVLHAFTIVRLWGLPTYLRCLRVMLSRRPTTFLAVVHASFARGAIRAAAGTCAP
jgi:hypothetical protein